MRAVSRMLAAAQSLSPHHSTTPVAGNGEDELRFFSRGCSTAHSENDDLCAAGLLEVLCRVHQP
jgi:hypothetical protein